jgi:hypothetical protein
MAKPIRSLFPFFIAPKFYSNWQRVPLARRASLGVVFAVFLLCIPSLAVHQVIEYPHHRWQPSPLCSAEKFAAMPNYSEPLFTVVIRPSALANGCWLFKGNLWLTGICFKVSFRGKWARKWSPKLGQFKIKIYPKSQDRSTQNPNIHHQNSKGTQNLKIE